MSILSRAIINISYALDDSQKYNDAKKFFYNLLENDNYRLKKYFDGFMITLIFLSVYILIRDVKHDINEFWINFNNIIISIIFLIEYLLRFWVSSSISKVVIHQNEHNLLLNREFSLKKLFIVVAKDKLKYILSIKAIIDLFAIIPFFHQLRLLRVLILFRVFKLFRYAKSFQTFVSVLATKKFEFITLLMFASIIIFVSSVLVYVMEANNPSSPINTLFDALYWSIVTISTVGYGDVTAVTTEGRAVALVVITSGIAVLAFSTSLVVSAFSEKLDEMKEMKSIDNVSKFKNFYLICGYEGVAGEVAKMLKKNDFQILVMDEDEKRIKQAVKDGFEALNFDPGEVDSYKKLNIDLSKHVKAVLALRQSDVENVYTTLTVRSMHQDVYILSLLMEEMHRNKLSIAGANEIIYAKDLVGMIAKEFVGQPVAFEVIHALRSEFSGVDMEEILVTGRILKYISSINQLENEKFRVVLLGIWKKESDEFIFNPKSDTVIELGDYLVVIGNSLFIREFKRALQKKIFR
ncbi:potassium channel family protein [Sulfurimonas lithotrophica]|uniref:potassium channel family protein n=1 Tax=Sulfurimonas lithotrophica TaxID=2590022 RepID=UPI001F52423A|nr:ion transporter [Sulfurimonas lithotrophica]